LFCVLARGGGCKAGGITERIAELFCAIDPTRGGGGGAEYPARASWIAIKRRSEGVSGFDGGFGGSFDA
jgi:hypothetical protein